MNTPLHNLKHETSLPTPITHIISYHIISSRIPISSTDNKTNYLIPYQINELVSWFIAMWSACVRVWLRIHTPVLRYSCPAPFTSRPSNWLDRGNRRRGSGACVRAEDYCKYWPPGCVCASVCMCDICMCDICMYVWYFKRPTSDVSWTGLDRTLANNESICR